MAPWTIFFRSIEDALYSSAHRLSSLRSAREDVDPVYDPLAPPIDDGPLAA